MCLLLGRIASESCTIVDNTDYSSSDSSLVTLYNLPSAQACCSACSGFEDCAYYSWNQNSGSSDYQTCTLYDKNSQPVSNTDTQAGANKGGVFQFQYKCSAEEYGIDYNNGYLQYITNVQSSSSCCTLCGYYTGCNYWVLSNSTCYLKASKTNLQISPGLTAGSVLVPPAPMRYGSKRGVAWFDSLSCSDLKLMIGITWIYNWAYQPDALLLKCINSLGIEYIPMIWGLPLTLGSVYNNSKYLLTFNEPNFSTQSNIDPATAASYWPQIQQFAQQNGMLIGSPAAADGGDIMDPVSWFDEFFSSCTNCQVDFISTHIYTCSPAGVDSYLASLKKYGKPIWLTEFSCPAVGDPEADEYAFLNQTLYYLDADDDFERYAWYGTRIAPTDTDLGPDVNLFNYSACSLTEVGKRYNSDGPLPTEGGTGSSAVILTYNFLLACLFIAVQIVMM